MNKKLRVFIIGCGYFGQKRIQACLRQKQHIEIAGVIDTNYALAKQWGTQLCVPYASSLTKLLKTTEGDAAIIAIPNCYHAAMVCEALKHGLHVLCEKPMTTTVKDAKKIIAASKKYGGFVKTGSNHRYFPTIKKASQLILKGTIGKITYIKGDIGTNGSHTKNSWFWDKHTAGGGTFIDNAPHLLDIARWFMGDFRFCTGSTANTYWKQAGVEDVAEGIYKTADGRLATITSSWTKRTGYMSLDIYGDKGYLLIDSKNGGTIIFGTNSGTKQKIFNFLRYPITSYDEELLYFATCIQKNIPPVPNALDGARVVQMIEGLYASARSNRRIKMTNTL